MTNSLNQKDQLKKFKTSTENEFEGINSLTIYEKYNRYILKIFFDLDENEIEEALYGLGSNDGGVDGYFINDYERTIDLYQFKTTDCDSSKQIENNTILEKDFDYLRGFEEKIYHQEWLKTKNKTIQDLAGEIKDYLSKEFKIVKYFFSMNSASDRNKEVCKALNIKLYDFEKIYEKYEEFLDKNSHEEYPEGEFTIESVNEAIKFQQVKTSEKRYSYFGVIKAQSLVEMEKKFGFKLFDNNVRYSLGASKPNNEMSKTIKGDPATFYYFNNGITITTDKAKPKDDGTKLTLHNPSIINGAQTTYTLSKENKNLDKISVLCRVVVRNEQDHEFRNNLTKYNNFHNPVKEIDFLSKRPEQKALHDRFKEVGIFYEHKRGFWLTLTKFEETNLKKSKADLKLNIPILTQILISIQGRPEKSKNIKAVLDISLSNNSPHEDYVKAIFERDLDPKKIQEKDLSEKRFKEILVAVCFYSAINKNIKGFQRARKLFNDDKKNNRSKIQKICEEEAIFLKGRSEEDLERIFKTYHYLVDGSFTFLATLWYAIIQKAGYLEKFTRFDKKEMEEIISQNTNEWFMRILVKYWNQVYKEEEANKINFKTFFKQPDAFSKIKDRVNSVSDDEKPEDLFKIS
jgi:hypothetical protein